MSEPTIRMLGRIREVLGAAADGDVEQRGAAACRASGRASGKIACRRTAGGEAVAHGVREEGGADAGRVTHAHG